MTLYIKQITIEKNGKITERYNFNDSVSVVCGSTEIYDIIKFLLGIRKPVRSLHNIRFFATVELDNTYYIRGRKNKGESFFAASVYKENEEIDCTEEYFNMVEQKEELDSVLIFHQFKKQDYPHKLFKYKDLLKYYPDGSFAKLTNGYGTTRSFRSFVTSYIKNFKPIRLYEDKELFLKLSKTGEFKVGYLDNDEDVCLSESENMLYHYLSFISIADFWARAEKIRNLNRVRKPLMVSCFTKFLDENIRFSEIIRQSNKIGRQVIMFADKQTQIQ